MSKPPAPSPPPSSLLVERLVAVQREHQGQPGRKRRSTLAQEIEQQLAGLAPADRAAAVEQALAAIRPSAPAVRPEAAGGGDDDRALRERLAAVVAEKDALVKERDGLRSTRDALTRENGKLRAELDARPSFPGVVGGGFDAFRSALKDAFDGRKVDPGKLGIAAKDVRLFRLTQSLMAHVETLDIIRVEVLNKLDVGAVGRMDSVLIQKYKQEIRKHILAVLSDQDGSIGKLQAKLKAQNEFSVGVVAAVESAIPIAVTSLLAKLEPDPILERSKRIMIDHERAWKEFAKLHSDLSNLTNEEIWDNYVREPFKEKLSEWTAKES